MGTGASKPSAIGRVSSAAANSPSQGPGIGESRDGGDVLASAVGELENPERSPERAPSSSSQPNLSAAADCSITARRGRTPFELRLTDDDEDPQTWEVKSTSLAPLSQLLALFFNKRRVVPPSLRRYNRVVIDGYGVLTTEDELKLPLKTFTQAAQGIVRVEVTLEQAELEAQRRGTRGLPKIFPPVKAMFKAKGAAVVGAGGLSDQLEHTGKEEPNKLLSILDDIIAHPGPQPLGPSRSPRNWERTFSTAG